MAGLDEDSFYLGLRVSLVSYFLIGGLDWWFG